MRRGPTATGRTGFASRPATLQRGWPAALAGAWRALRGRAAAAIVGLADAARASAIGSLIGVIGGLAAPSVAADSTPAAPAGYLNEATRERCATVLALPSARALQARSVALLAGRPVHDPSGWSGAVLGALCANDLPLTPEHMALVLALIEKESSFDAHGLLPQQPEGLRRLAYRLIDDLLAGDPGDLDRLFGPGRAARVLQALTRALTRLQVLDRATLRSLFDRQYTRFGWQRVRTEWDIENRVAPDLLILSAENSPAGLALRAVLAAVPALRERLVARALFHTVGPLQVGVDQAVHLVAVDGRALDEVQARRWLYQADAGVYFGVRRLADSLRTYAPDGHPSAMDAAFVAADQRLGPMASRNAALVLQLSQLAGRPVPPGTLINSARAGELMRSIEADLRATAARASRGLPAGPFEAAVRQMQTRSAWPDLSRHPLIVTLREAHRQRFGVEAPRALVPEQRLYSAKTGGYRVADIVGATRERFVANCARLGCRD